MAKKYGKIEIGGVKMNVIDENFLKELIYNKSKDKVLEELENVKSAEILHIYMNNYNWDNGFEIPRKVLLKSCCELSTALMIFYLADGERYLEDKNEVINSSMTEWSLFIQNLYKQIKSGEFKEGNIYFKPPLSKVQIYKIKKLLKEDEEIFIKEFGEKNLNIVL